MTNLGNVVTLVAPDDVEAGQGVVVGSIFGIAAHHAAKGAQVDCHVVGVFEVAKAPAEAWAQGDLVFWNKADKEATKTQDGHMKIGAAILPAADPSEFGQVRLNGAF